MSDGAAPAWRCTFQEEQACTCTPGLKTPAQVARVGTWAACAASLVRLDRSQTGPVRDCSPEPTVPRDGLRGRAPCMPGHPELPVQQAEPRGPIPADQRRFRIRLQSDRRSRTNGGTVSGGCPSSSRPGFTSMSNRACSSPPFSSSFARASATGQRPRAW